MVTSKQELGRVFNCLEEITSRAFDAARYANLSNVCQDLSHVFARLALGDRPGALSSLNQVESGLSLSLVTPAGEEKECLAVP